MRITAVIRNDIQPETQAEDKHKKDSFLSSMLVSGRLEFVPLVFGGEMSEWYQIIDDPRFDYHVSWLCDFRVDEE